MAPKKKTASRASSSRATAAAPASPPAAVRPAAPPAAPPPSTERAALSAAVVAPDPGSPEATVAMVAATRGMFTPGQKLKVVATRLGFDGFKRRYPADHGHKDSGKPFIITIGREGALPSWVEVAEGKPVRPKPIVAEEGEDGGGEDGNVI